MRKIILGIIILIMSISIYYAEEEWEDYKKEHSLPIDTPYESVGGLPFNKKLYEEKKIIVYGDYRMISQRENDFKRVESGYYKKSGKSGEYRYHGYSYDHSYVSNNNFPRDQESHTKLEDKKWVFHPWNQNSYAYTSYQKNFGLDDMSSLNHIALHNDIIASQINNGLSFSIAHSTFTGFDSAENKDPVNYIAIETLPSCFYTGQGMMFHQSKYGESSSGAWYQTVPIKRVRDKKLLPVHTTIVEKKVNIREDGMLTVYIRVHAALEDDFIYKESDVIERQIYFTREDIHKWVFIVKDDILNEERRVEGRKISANEAEMEYTFTIPKDRYLNKMDENHRVDINLSGIASCLFIAKDEKGNFKRSIGHFNDQIWAKGEQKKVVDELSILKVDITAPTEILDIWKFDLKEDIKRKELIDQKFVEIDGKRLSKEDETLFLKGEYQFPATEEDKIYQYKIVYVDKKGESFSYSSYVLVYTSMPRVNIKINNPAKVNRKISIDLDTLVNSSFLLEHSTIKIEEFTISSPTQIFYGIDDLYKKEFLVKEEGIITACIKVSNEYASRIYKRNLYIGKDYKPDIIAMIFNNNLTRNEELHFYFSADSLDNDELLYSKYEIYYDEDQDEIAEKLVYSGEDKVNFKPSYLGKYKVVFQAKEEITNTIEEYITEEDKQSNVVIREFYVDNLRPMTKIFFNHKKEFVKADIIFVLDKNLTEEDTLYLKENRVNIINAFRKKSVDASIDIVDTKIYRFKKTALVNIPTGENYPGKIYDYFKNGYKGKLNLKHVDNFPYEVDDGFYKVETMSKDGQLDIINNVSIYYNEDGSYDKTEYSYGMEETPYSLLYSDKEGYKGKVFKKLGGNSFHGKEKFFYENNNLRLSIHYWTAHYKGRVEKKKRYGFLI